MAFTTRCWPTVVK